MNKRDSKIDFIKAIAIISVILLHTLPKSFLLGTYAQLHIWQAVPIFVTLMGSTYFLSMSNKEITIKNMHLKKRLFRILLPIVTMSIVIVAIKSIFTIEIRYIYIFNFIPIINGPGTYFIILVIQAMLISPLVLLLFRKINNNSYFLIILFILNLIFEFFAFYISMNEFYPLLYSGCILRYIFAFAIGFVLYDNYALYMRNKLFLTFILMSFFYLISWGILNYNIPYFIERKEWQNVFSYMYTGALIFVLLKSFEYLKNSYNFKILMDIGKASWHIFLLQIFYFSINSSKLIFDLIDNYYTLPFIFTGIITVSVNLLITISLGVYWYNVESYLIKKGSKNEVKRII